MASKKAYGAHRRGLGDRMSINTLSSASWLEQGGYTPQSPCSSVEDEEDDSKRAATTPPALRGASSSSSAGFFKPFLRATSEVDIQRKKHNTIIGSVPLDSLASIKPAASFSTSSSPWSGGKYGSKVSSPDSVSQLPCSPTDLKRGKRPFGSLKKSERNSEYEDDNESNWSSGKKVSRSRSSSSATCSSKSSQGGGGGGGNNKSVSFSFASTTPKKKATTSYVAAEKEQAFLDLGQRSFGEQILCGKCGLLYVPGAKGDDKLHEASCKIYCEGVDFPGWKHERVIETFSLPSSITTTTTATAAAIATPRKLIGNQKSKGVANGGSGGSGSGGGGGGGGEGSGSELRVVEVRPGDRPSHIAKLAQVRTMMDQEMGFAEGARSATQKAFMCIKAKRVVGCVTVEAITVAYVMIADDVINKPKQQMTDHVHSDEKNGKKRKKELGEQGGGSDNDDDADEDDLDDDDDDDDGKGAFLSNDVTTTMRLSADSIHCEEEPCDVVMGVHQMWVLKKERGQGICRRLLDVARKKMMFGFEVPKEKMAFSQPTRDGQAVAQRYVAGGKCKLLVY